MGILGGRLIMIIIMLSLIGWALMDGKVFLRRVGFRLPVLLGGFLLVAAPMLQDAALHPDDFMARLRQVGLLHGDWFMKSIHEGGADPFALIWGSTPPGFTCLQFLPLIERPIMVYSNRGSIHSLSAFFLIGLGYATLGLLARRRRLLPLAIWYWSGAVLTAAC